MSALSSSIGSGPDGVVVEVPEAVLRRRRGIAGAASRSRPRSAW